MNQINQSDEAFSSQESAASWYSKWTFSYFMPILKLGYNKPLEMNDIWDLLEQDKAEYNHKKFLKLKSDDHLVYKLLILIKPLLYQQLLVGIISCFLTLIGPLSLQYLLSNLDGPIYKLFICLSIMTAASSLNALVHGRAYFLGRRIGTRIRSILISEIYSSALSKKTEATTYQDEATHGEIVNLMAVDTQKVLEYTCYMHYLVTTPLQIVVCTLALYSVLGLSAFISIVVMLVTLPIQNKLAKKIQAIQKLLLKKTDIRINRVNEMLQSIRIIKYFAWESKFKNQINLSRNEELFYLKKFRFIMALMDVVYMSIPILIPLITFSLYASVEYNVLTPSKVFTSLSLLQILRHPLRDLPDQIIKYYETKVSIERISRFITSNSFVNKKAAVSNKISFKNASFGYASWRIKPFTLNIPNNKLTVVIGSTSSGKSSLLQAILQEIPLLSGTMTVPNVPISYVSQQPWLVHATIRQNILFGSVFDEAKYHSVLHDACLLKDLKMLQGSDFTEIGQGGINLSGGQRQRIALARAIYQNNEIYVFDDALSAVDASTQNHVLQHCLLDQLKNKTRVIATHATKLLIPHADYIIIMDDGNVTHSGDYESLRPVLAELGYISAATATRNLEPNVEALQVKKLTLEQLSKNRLSNSLGSKLIEEEEISNGSVKFRVYLFYISCSGGLVIWLLLCCGEFINHGLRVSQDYWLNIWSTESLKPTANNTSHFLLLYIVLGMLGILFNFIFLVFEFKTALKGSFNIHSLLLNGVLNTPIRFFDVTPVGRVINRFSKDIQTVDRNVSNSLLSVLYCTLGTFVVVIMVISIAPVFIIGMIPVCCGYVYISKYYLKTSRELKRLESVNKSPIYSLFSQTLLGTETIRAFHKEHDQLSENYSRINYYQRAFFYLWVSNRWLGVRTEWLGSFTTFLSGCAILFSINWISAGLAGLCMSYSFTFTDQVLWMVRYNAELEMNLNSVERIQEYANLEQENWKIDSKELPAGWPTSGHVVVKDLTLRYADDNAPVLNNISFEIQAGNKVAVVGRTGAGKRS
eukprot:NODE_399_length_9361_cov_0.420428.p1 type:complete len:1038 gc:universal NODE_399_length_9361_cov_0.420428:245-3358(+)